MALKGRDILRDFIIPMDIVVCTRSEIEKWQNAVNPIWRTLSGGCNLNRDVPDILDKGGFRIKNLETMYLPGWRIANYNYWGTAQIR